MMRLSVALVQTHRYEDRLALCLTKCQNLQKMQQANCLINYTFSQEGKQDEKQPISLWCFYFRCTQYFRRRSLGYLRI